MYKHNFSVSICTTLLVYNFLQSGYPKYVKLLLKLKHSVYDTHRDQADGVVLEVTHLASSVFKSTEPFGF